MIISRVILFIMDALKIYKKYCGNDLPYELGNRLGFGIDGTVYSISNSNKVIKISILYNNGNLMLSYNEIKKVLDYLIESRPSVCAGVYEYGFDSIECSDEYWQRPFIGYYYVMEKLDEISDDESKVFHSILSHEDSNIIKNYSNFKIKKILNGLSSGLDFDKKKITLFCESLKRETFIHSDIHSRNIMKDGGGYFKLIDFDRMKLGE